MTFTEVVVEWSDPRQPLCRHTQATEGAFAVYRIVDEGRSSRRHRAHITYLGPAARAVELPREMQESHPGCDLEVLHRASDNLTLHLSAPLADEQLQRGLVSASVLLREQGLDPLVEPITFRAGRAQMRLLVPRPVDIHDLMRGLQEVQRSAGLQEFRVLRTQSIEPHAHVDLVRRLLPAEQEDLLRLAARMGYYETPKRATLEGIARSVGLSISPVHKRLKAAEETLVCARVQPTTAQDGNGRRRVRREHRRIDGQQQWDVHVRVRPSPFGPSELTASAPGSRVAVHVLSEDRATGAASLLVTALLPQETHEKVLASLQDRAEILRVTTHHRGPDHLTLRLDTRGRAGYGVAWWADTWRNEALLRPLLYENDELHLRLLLLKPLAEEAFLARMEEMARAAGWVDYEVVSIRPHVATPPIPAATESLTPRQAEVLRVAQALGYYRTPRGCTLDSVAQTLGVSANAIHKNLVLAESKIIASYLAAGL